MRARTILPERVLEAATQIHLSLVEADFYTEECQVIINELDVIEYIGIELLPRFFKDGDCTIEDDKFESFLRGIIAFTVLESLKEKGLIDSISIDDDVEEVYFMPKKVKEELATKLSTKNAA